MKNELKLMAYIDYKQLERKLNIDLGDEKDIQVAYDYISDLQKYKDYRISFTNVDIDLGYFDFYYKDMLLTISIFNRRGICKLGESIELYEENGNFYGTITFNDLEREILKG